MDELKLVWQGKPIGKDKKYCVYRNRMILSKEYRKFKSDMMKQFYYQFASYIGHYKDKKIAVTLYVPTNFDCDALIGAIYDSLQGIGIIKNDNQIYEGHQYKDIITKRGENTHIDIIIREIEGVAHE
jgi:Holliday junction resolvase RusA-like endonuclease